MRCFNEAEAIKPRNQHPALRRDGDLRRASMRPRQSSLGIVTDDTSKEPTRRASMRPRQSSLGIENWRLRQQLLYSASMRPRQSSLGIRIQLARRRLPAKASMRPRQSSLGIYKEELSAGETSIEGFNEAEAIKPRNQPPFELLSGVELFQRSASAGLYCPQSTGNSLEKST